MTRIKAKRWTFSLLTSQTLLLGMACSMLSVPAVAANNNLAPAAPVSLNEAPPPWSGGDLPAATAETAEPVAEAPVTPVEPTPEAVASGSSIENWYRNRRTASAKANDALAGLEAAAQSGDANAQYRLAMRLRSDDSQANISQSLDWQKRAAQAGNAEAQYGLGLLYANGQYVPADNKQAQDWFQQAASQGHVAARLALLSLNNGAPAQAVAASGQLRNEPRPKSEPVNAPAPPAPENAVAPVETQNLASLQLEPEPAPQATAPAEPPPRLTPKPVPVVDPASMPEPVAMKASLQPPANNAGGASNSMDMAGIEPSVLRQSAEAGDKQAQLMLGTMYEDGVAGLPSDLREAAYWYEQAARQDYPKAQYNLGLLYEDGRGVKQNFKQAAYWYEKASKAGFGEAQNNLGVLFILGKGVNKDPKRAEKLFTDAASNGNADAQRNLDMLRQG